jgi:WD40 repeat protein
MGSKSESFRFNPFPGLRPFAPEESDLFFGREMESNEVLQKLMKNRFITVIGASGTGKSSLIYCGVLPKVGEIAASESSSWTMIIFRPGNDPFGNLAEAISEKITSGGMPKVQTDNILLEMHLNEDGITSAFKKYLVKGTGKILMIIDQFEELFRYGKLGENGPKGTHAYEFVTKMVRAISQPESIIYTILTMRSDFIGECAHYQGLTQLINSSNYLVPHMDRENYRQAIEGPVKYAGASIDPKLVENVLDDIGDRTDQLPVLQHALMRTWTYWQELDEGQRPLSFTDYDAVGTMSDAMSRHANEAFEELDPRGREICEKLFKAITEKGADNKGIRHPLSVSTLKAIIQCTSEELFGVVEKFRVPSRSFLTPRQDVPLTDESIIDLSHESLMRLWNRLREWVDDEASSVQMYLRLSEASAMFQQGKTSLWRPPDLQLAINWRDQHKPTLAWAQRYDPAFERAMVYLRTSEQEFQEEEEGKIRLQKKQIRRTKIVAGILGTAAFISLLFMLFAFIQKIAADRATDQAKKNAEAEAYQRHIADSTSKVAIRQKDIADSANIFAQQQKDIAVVKQIEADNQRKIAVTNAKLATEQSIRAEREKDSATMAQARAVKSAEYAEAQRKVAQQRQMLAIGKQMSIKSLQVQDKRDLQTLLAYQAYLFNKNNGGRDNDADIYNGLYTVASKYGNSDYKNFKGHTGQIRSIAFVPGKREFYTSGDDRQVLKWNLDGESSTYQVIYQGTDIIDVLTVSPDAAWLACGSNSSSIHLIPLKGSSMKYDLTGHTAGVKSLIFSYDGKYLYSAALDGKILKWDLAARTSTNVNTGAIQINSIDISSNGKYLAGVSRDGKVIVWNQADNNDNFKLPTEGKEISVIRFKPDENILAIGDISGNVELYDVSTQKQISAVKAHTARINDIRFNPTLKQMATASNDGLMKLFNISDINDLTEPPVTISDNDDFVIIIQFSPEGDIIVSGTYGKNSPNKNLVSRPTHVNNLVKDICTLVTRNMTQEEWNTYVGKEIPIEATCPNQKSYNIKANAVK